MVITVLARIIANDQMIAVHDRHIEPIFITHANGRRRPDGLPIIRMLLRGMRNPCLTAYSSIPGLSSVATGNHPCITDPFSHPGPDVRMFSALLKNGSAVGMRTIGVKPTQQPDDHSFSPEWMKRHGFIIGFERVRIF